MPKCIWQPSEMTSNYFQLEEHVRNMFSQTGWSKFLRMEVIADASLFFTQKKERGETVLHPPRKRQTGLTMTYGGFCCRSSSL